MTQKKVRAAGSPVSERRNKVRAFEESLRWRCGPTAHRSKDSEIEFGPSAPTEWTVRSRSNTFFTFPPFLRGSVIVKTALLVVLHYSIGTNSSDIAPSTWPEYYTLCYHTLGTGMSEAPVLVPIFPYAAEGGARPSCYFRQGNWECESNCLKIFDEKIAPQANFMKQIAPQVRFFWLNPDVYKIFLTAS